MTKKYYECHITMEGSPQDVQEKARKWEGSPIDWKFSAIDGDILLGDGLKCYYTKHFNVRVPAEEVLSRLHAMAECLEYLGIKVTRRKVEMVLYDDRSTKTSACTSGCIACHLDDLKPWHAEGGYT